ncbi:hypothetical protein [Chloroflexus sp.]|uniref:hypothetical protein n=1 Tax=Chloroflexus sp. TaxID=1904827 RepID=UPI00263150AB|nr:hypothetical protein [uncultured Chloroflexus sp.]
MAQRWLYLITVTVIVLVSFSAAQPARAEILDPGAGGCPVNTIVGGDNLVQNGDFAQGAVGFTTALTNRGAGVYPDDANGGGFSIQTGSVVYPPFETNPYLYGRPFPGDPQRDVPATDTYFYSNPSVANYEAGNGRVMLWQQTVTVAPNTTYNFFAYFDNLLDPVKSANGAADPIIELRVNNVSVGTTVVPKTPDQWVLIQFAFTTGSGVTSITLRIDSLTNSSFGDDFVMTQINLKQCVSGVGVAKYALPPVAETRDGREGFRLEYWITFRNLGADPVSDLQAVDDLATVFAAAEDWELVELSALTESGFTALTVNPAFDGRTNLELLASDQVLDEGQRARLRLIIWVRPPTGPTVFQNIVNLSARSGNVTVTDVSLPGLDPDPNGNGDPKEQSERGTTVTIFSPLKYWVPIVLR